MADSKISALPAGGAITGAEIPVAVQGGVTSRFTWTALKAWVLGSPIITGGLTAPEQATPATPGSGFSKIYPKTDGSWAFVDDGGVVHDLAETEVGDWTPAISYQTPGTLSVTHITQNGRYVLNGKKCTVWAQLALSAFTKGTASGNLIVTGQPFSAAAGAPNAVGTIALNLAPFSSQPFVWHLAGGSFAWLYRMSTNAGIVSLDDPDADSQYFISYTYEID